MSTGCLQVEKHLTKRISGLANLAGDKLCACTFGDAVCTAASLTQRLCLHTWTAFVHCPGRFPQGGVPWYNKRVEQVFPETEADATLFWNGSSKADPDKRAKTGLYYIINEDQKNRWVQVLLYSTWSSGSPDFRHWAEQTNCTEQIAEHRYQLAPSLQACSCAAVGHQHWCCTFCVTFPAQVGQCAWLQGATHHDDTAGAP